MDDENTGPDPKAGSASEVPLPSGIGVTLDDRPSAVRQFALGALGGVGFSLFVALQGRIRSLVNTPTELVLTFFITLAALIVVWLAAFGFRTLDRRRLLRRFPGTLVFSFRQTSDVVNRLRQLDAFVPGRRDFDFGSVQIVADLRGLTFWQRNPPARYGSVPWSAGESLEIGRYPGSQRSRAETTVDIHARSGDESVEISLAGADASILPLPTRREVEWVHQQLERLFSASR